MKQKLPSFQEFKRRSLQSSVIPFHLPTFAGPSHKDVDSGGISKIENKTIVITAIKSTIALPAISSALSSLTNMEPQRPAPPGHPMSGAPCLSLHCKNKGVSGGYCKKHGGRRCTHVGCKKSSQSKGLCRRHGGGTLCSFEGCTRGPQRAGLCHSVSIFYVVEININRFFCSMEEEGCVQWPVASRRIEGKVFVSVMVEENDVWYKIVIEQREKNNIV